jgi:hypothetical protein
MHAIALLALAACGDDGGSTRSDGGPPGDDQSVELDAAVDARPPNTAHRGLIQGIRLGMNTSTPGVGFYEVPGSATGCTWTYAAACSLQSCDVDSGLVPMSAGDITYTVGGTPITIAPDGSADYPNVTSPPMAPGTSVMASAPGATVPAFTTATLVTPDPIMVLGPPANTTISQAQPLTTSWTPAAGRVYINLSQSPIDGPYPSTYRHTIRCDADAMLGTYDIPTELIAGLEPGTNLNFVLGASVTDIMDVGDYEVMFRLLDVEMVRTLTVQ